MLKQIGGYWFETDGVRVVTDASNHASHFKPGAGAVVIYEFGPNLVMSGAHPDAVAALVNDARANPSPRVAMAEEVLAEMNKTSKRITSQRATSCDGFPESPAP